MDQRKADSTLRSSQAVPHPSTNRALRRLTSEVERDPVHSTRYGRQRRLYSWCCQPLQNLGHGLLQALLRRWLGPWLQARRRLTESWPCHVWPKTRNIAASCCKVWLGARNRSRPLQNPAGCQRDRSKPLESAARCQGSQQAAASNGRCAVDLCQRPARQKVEWRKFCCTEATAVCSGTLSCHCR